MNTTGGLLGAVLYDTGFSVGSPGSIGTQFTTNLTSTSGSSIVSSITFTPTMDINNYTVQCRAIDTNTPALIGTDTCSILIKGMYIISDINYLFCQVFSQFYFVHTLDILPAPVPNELTANLNYFTFSWTPQSTSPCFSSYIVFVNSSVSNVTYTTTNTSQDLPTQPFNDTEYSVSVVAVDTGGRYMEPQGIETFIPDGK